MSDVVEQDPGTGRPLVARPLRSADSRWLLEWFRDPLLDRELGPIDQDWVDAVVNDVGGVELVIQLDSRPLALVGCSWDLEGGAHAVTGIAVDPRIRRQGIGTLALDAALAWDGHPPPRAWLAFVASDNRPAQAFFDARGWARSGPHEDGMIPFVGPRI